MAERYELASFKSAGVPLTRIMYPLAVIAMMVSLFSFFCANNLIPMANLQFKSRLWDIRKHESLKIEPGAFNDDFKGISIYIGSQGEDGRTIKDVLIYDESNSDGRYSQINAETGEMYISEDERFFVMELYNGTQNQEVGKSYEKGKRNYQFVRTNFKEYKKVFDLGQFDLNETNKNLFKSHQTMLSIRQLQDAADSLDVKIAKRLDKTAKQTLQYFYFEKKRDTILFKPVKKHPKKFEKSVKDSLKNTATAKKTPPKITNKPKQLNKPPSNKKTASAIERKANLLKNIVSQELDKNITEYDAYIETFVPAKRKQLLKRATSFARNIQSGASSDVKLLERQGELRVKYEYELYSKFSMALVCFIFLFIGGPMGAIVRKGGFGYPILIAITFFVLFIVMTIGCKKLGESFVLTGFWAAWIPCLILIPIAGFLTYKAMMDSKLLNTATLNRWATKGKRLLRMEGEDKSSIS